MIQLLGGAGEKGISEAETGAVLANVMLVAAGAMRNKTLEAKKKLKKRSK